MSDPITMMLKMLMGGGGDGGIPGSDGKPPQLNFTGMGFGAPGQQVEGIGGSAARPQAMGGGSGGHLSGLKGFDVTTLNDDGTEAEKRRVGQPKQSFGGMLGQAIAPNTMQAMQGKGGSSG